MSRRAANQIINLSSNSALCGSFDQFAATSKACIGMVWTLLSKPIMLRKLRVSILNNSTGLTLFS